MIVKSDDEKLYVVFLSKIRNYMSIRSWHHVEYLFFFKNNDFICIIYESLVSLYVFYKVYYIVQQVIVKKDDEKLYFTFSSRIYTYTSIRLW